LAEIALVIITAKILHPSHYMTIITSISHTYTEQKTSKKAGCWISEITFILPPFKEIIQHSYTLILHLKMK